MLQQEIFDSLARNAFDFLNRAILDFAESPKYSVIHFCAAVEMLLKARLMCEHWSLIVAKPNEANLDKFVEGDFISVTLSDARARLKDIAKEDISSDAYNSFRALANHRNKMIHFFHKALESDDAAKTEIVIEQCRAWFHLHRLLRGWKGYFSDFDTEIRDADYSMKAHGKYLQTKFKALKAELENARKEGNVPQECNICHYKAAIPTSLDDQVAFTKCLVCDYKELEVKLTCPHCQETTVVAGNGDSECQHCHGELTPEDVFNSLYDSGDAHAWIADGDDTYQPGNCGYCDGYHTVVKRGDYYLCTDCFDWSDTISQCEWCQELKTGNLQYSYAQGCGVCEGRMGHEKDD